MRLAQSLRVHSGGVLGGSSEASPLSPTDLGGRLPVTVQELRADLA